MWLHAFFTNDMVEFVIVQQRCTIVARLGRGTIDTVQLTVGFAVMMGGRVQHFQPIEIVVIVRIVQLEVVKVFLVLRHFRQALFADWQSLQVIFEMAKMKAKGGGKSYSKFRFQPLPPTYSRSGCKCSSRWCLSALRLNSPPGWWGPFAPTVGTGPCSRVAHRTMECNRRLLRYTRLMLVPLALFVAFINTFYRELNGC